MARKPIDIGTVGNDGTGDSIRDAFRKVNDNFRELYSSLGLGERLRFRGLDDTPDTYLGQENAVVTVNSTEEGLAFRKLEAGSGIQIDFDSNQNAIILNNELSNISGDTAPNLGGALNAQFGIFRFPIGNLPDISNIDEMTLARSTMQSTHGAEDADPSRIAVNKGYADTKISLAGVDTIDPATGIADQSLGTMTGPLVLSRDPIPEDDEVFNGLVAATKRYVDGAGFGSAVNLYVATSGSDDRNNITRELQGRALSFAYRTIEAALKRAEELVLEAPIGVGPYKKVLTYNDGAGKSTLKFIDSVENSGSGFVGQVVMSLEELTVTSGGSLYRPGDKLTLIGGTFVQAASIEVLSVNVVPGTGGRGAISTFRVLATGVYTALPGSTNISATTTSEFGSGATFSATYYVNSIGILTGGSGYGLVSVRIVGGGGSGAFGKANIVGGSVSGISVTSRGTGFTTIPNVILNLPRFFLETEGYRTDFTGDLSDDPNAIRTRDLREGLLLRGETSGALAQILGHTGALSTLDEDTSIGRPDLRTCEQFEVDLLSGSFEIGEVISFGDVTKNIQICVFVEAGIYEENYPLKIPQNVAIIGDEFRRTIIKPKGVVSGVERSGMSTSPWVGSYFRRDKVFDGMQVATQEFGRHYLSDSSLPIYPMIDNRGSKRAAANLIDINRDFIKTQVIGWINYQIALATYGNSDVDPDNTSFWYQFTYNQELCRRDVGLIVDSMVFDLKYGGSNRTVSAALKYFQSVSSVKAITTQKESTIAGIQQINVLIQDIINNTVINTLYTQNGDKFDLDEETELTAPIPQTIDQAFVAEENSDTVIAALTGIIVNILTDDPSTRNINWPKNNDQLDVFLCNDANIVRAVTCQGHGGFMMVLDPEGQILTKSPYCQESAAFCRSTGRKTFAGGMFVDGFTGNQEFRIKNVVGNNLLEVDGLMRIPNTPCSFIVNDVIYRINYVRNYNYSIAYPTLANQGTDQWYGTAQFILDETTPWTFGTFEYQSDICRRDVGLILDGLGYDIVLQTNYHQRKAGFTYRQANAKVVVDNQLNITVRSITYVHDEVKKLLLATNPNTPESVLDEVTASSNSINQILKDGINYAPTLILNDPAGTPVEVSNAKNLLLANIEYIKAETIGWINAQINSSISPFLSTFVYDSVRCARDVGFLVEALAYDLIYGGNSQTRDAALKYYDGVGDAVTLQLAPGQEAETAAAILRVSAVCQAVILSQNPANTFSSVARINGDPATNVQTAKVDELLLAVAGVVAGGVGAAPVLSLPDITGYGEVRLSSRTTVASARTSLQDKAIFFVNLYGNTYEILMPGNRSMLSNDFTQVADLGYGLVVSNGGLTEAVSMFTYYCQISYYALSGGQIRSIGGSSSHGNYALVAEGSDPLEIPRPVSLYHNLSQAATVVANTVNTINKAESTVIFVSYTDYLPLSGSELEVNHSNQFVRYPISSVELIDKATKTVRLSIGNAEGLSSGIPHGQTVVIRQNSFVVLTGDIVDVATRPSTALVLRDSNFVYRVLEFNDYDEEFDQDEFAIVDINVNTGVFTTDIPHRQIVGRQVKIKREASDILPSAIDARKDSTPVNAGTVYYISSVPSPTTFTISTSRTGSTLDLSQGPAYGGTLTAMLKPYGLALTQLRENYNFIVLDLIVQPYRDPSNLSHAEFTATDPAVVTTIVAGTGNGSSGGTPTAHNLTPGSQIKFSTENGSLPGGVNQLEYFWVVSKDLTANTFKVSKTPPVYSTFIGVDGNLDGTTITGLVSTDNLTPGMRLIPKANIAITSVVGNGSIATVTFAQQKSAPYLKGQTISISGVADVLFDSAVAEVLNCSTTQLTYANNTNATSSGGTISVPTTGSLGTNPRILTVVNETTLTIANDGGSSNGSVVFDIEGEEAPATSTGSNVRYGLLLGDQGQSTIAVTDLPLAAENRIIDTVFNYNGEEYTITAYQEKPNGVTYSVITLDKPLETSAISYLNPIALRSGISVPSENSIGTLTIRIALVRVTSHDFLEIGTGSYADTNYPNDIFGPPVNDFAGVPLYTTEFDEAGSPITRAQVQERGVGRSFFVTTDQFGNFSVGPFFKVDQGTGTVTFAASIALSQLDGLGFKRGATVSEFSVDDSLDGAANDAVPTEGAVRGYIDRRLGISHEGVPILEGNIIPSGAVGGFMALSGLLAMKGNMDLGNYVINNLGAPILDSDAARLDSIRYNNLKDVDGTDLLSFSNISRGQLTVMSGDVNNVVNVTPTGDISFTMNTTDLTNKVIQTSINPGVIVDADINTVASIAQSKLAMNAASTRSSAAGITQGERGLSSFDSSQFTAENGWISVKDNGLLLGKLEQISARHVLANPSSTSVDDVSTASFESVVRDGGAIRKEQFASGSGYIKRSNSTIGSYTSDGHFTIVDDDSNKSSSTLVRRDANGDFAGRDITADQFKLQTTSTGTFVAIKSNQQSETNGFLEVMCYGGGGGSQFAGLQIGAGGTATNNKTNYNNTIHEFRSQNGGTSYATIDVNGLDLGARRLAVSSITSVTSISTGSQTTPGTITGRWTLTGDPTTTGSRFQATYAADLAEYYEGDEEYEVGTVLVFGGEKEVTISTSKADTRIAGVVSNTAAYTMYGACPGHKNLLALQGRVPCKVVGKIEKGDILVTSDIQGVAMAAGDNVKSGTMIGKAIESYDSDQVGTIQVAVGRT